MSKRKPKPWRKRIAEARKRGGFTRRDKQAAHNWPTCACGQLDVAIPRYRDGDGEPSDYVLSSLGCDFASAVEDNRFRDAELIIGRITKRAAQVLREAQ